MKRYLSPLILLSAAILWGLAFVMQKAATVIPTFTLLFSRSVIATVALIPVTVLFDKTSKCERHLWNKEKRRPDINRRELVGGMICGIFLYAASALQQEGISDTDAGITSFITALYVVIVPIYALLFGKKSPLNAWLGILISVFGFYLLCIKDGFTMARSDLLVFGCAFIFAMHIMTVDAFLPGSDGIRLSLIQFATVSILSLVSAIIFEDIPEISEMVAVMPEILYLGICSSGIAYTLQIIGQKNTKPAIASIILSLESVFGALFSALVLKERMSLREYIGSALVFAAVIISQTDFTFFRKAAREGKDGSTKNSI